MDDPLAPVVDIMRRHGVSCSAQEFHAAVNITFHRFESELYDELHQDMWESLPVQIELLAKDCLSAPVVPGLRMLDIGCGTGLATELLLRSALGPNITEVDLLDTSTAMLERAKGRRKGWGKAGETMEGLVESLAGKKQYDLIITSSVLHHVPDLRSFLGAVTAMQKDRPGALFLHLQDPNGDYPQAAERRAREADIPRRKLPEWAARLAPSRILARLGREIRGEQGQDYLSKTNRELVKSGIVSTPLAVAEIFTITDIHVQDGTGISIEWMKDQLAAYDLVSRRSYAFFGELRSNLAPKLRVMEDRLIQDGAPDGAYIAAAWRLRAP